MFTFNDYLIATRIMKNTFDKMVKYNDPNISIEEQIAWIIEIAYYKDETKQ